MSNDAASLSLACPSCGRPTESLKQYRLIRFLLFFGLGVSAQAATYTMCPDCMRGQIVKNALINVLTANVVFPFVLLPMFSVQFLRTLTKGHSASVRKEVDAVLLRRSQPAAA